MGFAVTDIFAGQPLTEGCPVLLRKTGRERAETICRVAETEEKKYGEKQKGKKDEQTGETAAAVSESCDCFGNRSDGTDTGDICL